MKSLADIGINEKGIVKRFSNDELSIKLIEMGCLPGAEVQVSFTAPFKGPIAIKVAGYHLSLRREEAQCVELED